MKSVVAFIGVIAESKNEIQIKRILDNSLNSKHKQHMIIAINDKNIDNIKNIRFETILVTNLDGITNKNAINELLKNAQYLVISADIDSRGLQLNNNVKLNVITFGFNQKSTITASSVEDGLMIFIQRKIYDINGNPIEPQEIETKNLIKMMPKNAHNSMGIAGIILIYRKK